ncbi:unnamed protein product [Effrenium voratum]|nr:unnamed protein product [Effrenium voratum]
MLRGFAIASGSLGGRYLLGDALTQRFIERKEQIDLRRSGLFSSFGLVMGFPAYLFYAQFPRVLERHFPVRWKLIALIAVDWAVFLPLVYLPVFYTFREAIYNSHGDGRQLLAAAGAYWARSVASDLSAATPLLVTSDVVMFTALPGMWRVPFLSSIGLIWVVYISLKRGSPD